MDTTEPCKICGCTETNLIDGFYYCIECGTQDTNIRETVIESMILDAGAFAMRCKKRISRIPQATEVQMTDEWYKWHSLNFLLKGLADELIELGAAPSFKTKLLWIWTKYMKKYQHKADFGLESDEESDQEKDGKIASDDNEFGSDDEESFGRRKKNKISDSIKHISMPLVITFLYVALNLDKSHIQLSHLLRFIREDRISILQWRKLVPQELRPQKLRRVLFFQRKSFKYSVSSVRYLGLSLFRELDLGNPVVPDLRPLVDEYMQELCLPKDLKPLVLSLMHFRSYHTLDINVQYEDVCRIPSYELHVISHIIMALKICFGLDGIYEEIIADAVDKINDFESYPRSYNSETTGRLFSFRDWCSYLQFRKCLLRTHTLHLGSLNYFDMNDYVSSEHQIERPDYKINLIDEITRDILKNMPTVEPNVIPKSEFCATTTPHTSYANAIAEHLQDPNVKKLLREDFTQYSLKYILEDMFLVDPDSPNPRNILTGLCESSVRDTGIAYDFQDPSITFLRGHVYVKDCDNHNWMKTQRPQLQHVTNGENNYSSEKENDIDDESDSEIAENLIKARNINLNNNVTKTKQNGIICNDGKNINNTTVSDIDMDIDSEEKSNNIVTFENSCTGVENNMQLLVIKDEDQDRPIFDDDFVELETKKEDENIEEMIDDKAPNEDSERLVITDDIYGYTEVTQIGGIDDKDSDASSVDSIRLNPENLNRNDAIKELVMHACTKYKIPKPFKFTHPRYYRQTNIVKKPIDKREKRLAKGESKRKILGLISAYHSHVQNDIFQQMSNMVQSAIADFKESRQPGEISDIPVESGDALPDHDKVNNDYDDTNNITVENELNDINVDPEPNEVQSKDYNLFGDSSDGETHAEELLSKKNPEYDEVTHDIRQLYIKPAENMETPDMVLDPKLSKIVEKQIEVEESDACLLERTHNMENKEDSDSEEEITLSLFQEQKRIRKQLTAQEHKTRKKHLKPLFNCPIPTYKYWIRHYRAYITNNREYLNRFAQDIYDLFPDSFVFVLKECADIVGYPPYTLYKGLQRVESFLKHKYVQRKRFSSAYFENENKKCKTKDF